MQYKSGTVSVTNGSATATLSGNTADASSVGVGDFFKLDLDGDAIYQIASRTPSSGATLTSMTLTALYGGSTVSGSNYQIVKDFSANRGYIQLGQGDSDAADWITKLVNQIDTDMAILLGINNVPRVPTPAKKTGTSYTVSSTDAALIIQASATFTLTLPSAATYPGRILHLKSIAAFAVNSASSNVKPISTDTAGTAILTASAGKWAKLISDGANWIVMAAN